MSKSKAVVTLPAAGRWVKLGFKKKLKRMQIGEEEFFLLCVLAIGAPDPSVRDYYVNNYEKGTGAYLKHHKHGKVFVNLVTTHGEAKARATKWYWGYIRWWQEQYITKMTPEAKRTHYRGVSTYQTLVNSAKSMRLFTVRKKGGTRVRMVIGSMLRSHNDTTVSFSAYVEVIPTVRSEDYELVEIL